MSKRRLDSYALSSSRPVLFTETRDDAETIYTVALDGREYRLSEPRARTKTGIAIVASRFARDIATGKYGGTR